MRIIVTGSKGAIGQYLVPYLRLQQNHVIGCDIVPDYNDGYVLSDVTKPQELERIFQELNPDVVIHLAALYGRLANERYANIAVDTNVTGTNNMIQLCKRYKSKLIFFSTSEVYGNQTGLLNEIDTPLQPNNRYGIVKKMCEDLIRYEVVEHNLDAVILRLNMVYSS
jgi:nucleoside-diphosphate-sugar epimerase